MSNELEIFDKSTLKKTEQRVREMQDNGEVDFPPNYSPGNALKSAWLKLQSTTDKNNNPVLESCSRASVMEAMLDTVMQGLNPSKDQVYYIPYGKKLVAQRSYFGDMAVVKRVEDIEEIRSNLIYKGDEITINNENGRSIVEDHETSWENRQNEIAGAYAVVVFGDDRPDRYEIMTKGEIEQSWDQSKMNNSPTQNDFPGEMAKRTVVRRACKTIINSSDDEKLLAGKPEITNEQALEKQVEEEKDEKANSEVIDIETDGDQETESEEEPEPEEEPEDEDEEEENEMVPPGQRGDKPF